VEVREKERSKLMYRLDAADSELQVQLNTQRRRLQEEAEAARVELYNEIKTLKANQLKEFENVRLAERQRMEVEIEIVQKDKEAVNIA